MTSSTVQDSLRSIAGHGLAGAVGNWPDGPLPDDAWRELQAGVDHQRLSGLLVEAVRSGDLPVTDEQADAASNAHFSSLCGALLLESECLQVVRWLQDAGVGPRVLKGSAVAHLDYPDPSLRLFGDVDLIVRPEEFDPAVAALAAHGCARRFPEPRPGYDRRFSKGTSFTTGNGLEIDLHRTFVMGPFGLRVDLDELWGTSEPFELAGHPLMALDPDMRFVHACFHAALGDKVPRLVPQRDVAQMLLSGRLRVDRIEDIGRRWNVQPVLARAITTAWNSLRIKDITRLSDWAEGYRFDARALRELAVYHDPNGSYAAKQLAALGAIPRWRDKVAFVTALAFPQRSYVEDRHERRSARIRRGLTAARHRNGRT